MEVPGEDPTADARQAPPHVVDMLVGIMCPFNGPPESLSSVTHARARRAEAQAYAGRIWSEAWTAGASWGLARNTRPIRIEVAPERIEQIVRELG